MTEQLPPVEDENPEDTTQTAGKRRPRRARLTTSVSGPRRGLAALIPLRTSGNDDGHRDAKADTGDDEQPPSDRKQPDLKENCVDFGPAHRDLITVPAATRRRDLLARLFSFVVLPFMALLLALTAAYFKYEDATARESDRAGVESVQAAREATIAMLSYTPDTADTQLTAAADRLAGTFRDSYTSLIRDVVIPGAKQKRVSATTVVPAAARVSTTEGHAVVLVFVDQTIAIGDTAPTNTTSVVRVTLDKLANRWLVIGFEPK